MNCYKSTKRMIVSILWIVLGVALNVMCYFNLLDDFWQGFGGGLVIVGAVQLVRHIRYRTNDEYKEKVDIQVNDERNKFLSNKAWAWAGYIFVICAAIGTIAFKTTGKDELSMFCSMAICLMLVVYWISYIILKRKY